MPKSSLFKSPNLHLVENDVMGQWLGKMHTGDCVDVLEEMPAGSAPTLLTVTINCRG